MNIHPAGNVHLEEARVTVQSSRPLEWRDDTSFNWNNQHCDCFLQEQ